MYRVFNYTLNILHHFSPNNVAHEQKLVKKCLRFYNILSFQLTQATKNVTQTTMYMVQREDCNV